ncbi:MAG TPA: 4Fe-4S single cluster domain-containing protein [Candidatus Hydrogenedentes bacterium]|nr:4Fe-4S single cluster domain-containing protein [Candidatus Hydrogenedentota bacterium]
MTSLRLFALSFPVTALGPGNRAVLWVAGCARGCPGCISPEMQPADAGREVPVPVLAERLLKIEAPLAGVTVSGGEPFDQAEALAELLERLLTARPEWNSLLYTGYTLGELAARPDASRLLSMTDILVDGPFRRDVPQAHPLAGSGNQGVHYLTDRGRSLRADVDALPVGGMNYGLSADGTMDMVIGVTSEAQRRGTPLRGAPPGSCDGPAPEA